MPAGAQLLTLPQFNKLHTKSVRNVGLPAGFKHLKIFLNLISGADITGGSMSISINSTHQSDNNQEDNLI